MLVNAQKLQIALESLDLSDSATALIKELLQNLDGSNINLESLIEQLPMEIIAELQAFLEPSAGEEQNQHGRMQDAEAFKVHSTDIKTGDADNAETDMMTGTKLSMAGPIANSAAEIPEDTEEDETSLDGMMMYKRSQLLQFFEGRTDDPFDFEFRTIDATGNNTINNNYGATGTAFMTTSGYEYADGMAMPNDISRPSPRSISNEIFAQSGDVFNTHGISNYLWVWGQFLDHDINLTREGHGESYDISVPMGDAYFDPFFTGTSVITFTRSGYKDGSGEAVGDPRLQMNDITAFIDASNVYGSTIETANSLRAEGGKLLMGGNNLLPLFPGDHGMEFKAGDVRANENVGLTSMHTIFAREHNHWVDWLASHNPDYSDDKLYETAKAIVEAEIQSITYNEFLPLLLGENAIPEYQGYNPLIDPQIATEFATAAFRVGHTMLSSTIQRLQENGDESVHGNLTLQNAFFRPDIILTQGGIDEIVRGLGSSYSQAIDASIIDDVRNFLFGPPGAGGFDLVSLNIQRGRDHGIPDFNEVREAYGLPPLASFAELTSDVDVIAKLTALYGDISNLDLWVGGLIESPHGDSLLGETFFTIIADQFTRLRDGDRFWFENRFDEEFLDIIQDTSLSDIIMRNTDIDYLQEDIFTTQIRMGGDDTDNILNGTDEGDLIIGFGGDDALNGGLGKDTLYGGEGNDIFVFDTFDGTIDNIRDFNVEDDKIDISNLLQGYDPFADMIDNFISLTQDNQDVSVQIDRDGTGNIFDFEKFLVLDNVSVDDNIDFVLV